MMRRVGIELAPAEGRAARICPSREAASLVEPQVSADADELVIEATEAEEFRTSEFALAMQAAVARLVDPHHAAAVVVVEAAEIGRSCDDVEHSADHQLPSSVSTACSSAIHASNSCIVVNKGSWLGPRSDRCRADRRSAAASSAVSDSRTHPSLVQTWHDDLAEIRVAANAHAGGQLAELLGEYGSGKEFLL